MTTIDPDGWELPPPSNVPNPQMIPNALNRPEWLPNGHAFCPGPKEAYKMRMNSDPALPQFQSYMICTHGEYLSIMEAWIAHDAMPDHGAPREIIAKYQDEPTSEESS